MEIGQSGSQQGTDRYRAARATNFVVETFLDEITFAQSRLEYITSRRDYKYPGDSTLNPGKITFAQSRR